MDALRTLAATAVVLNHSRDLMMQDYQPGSGAGMALFYGISGLGHQAVIFFFVLSGYWITKSVARRSPDRFWTGYLIDRLSRLWIVIFPALLVTAAFDFVGLAIGAPVYSAQTGAHSIQPVHLDLTAYLGTLAFLQSLVVPTPGSNGPLWSLAYEFWYYVCFAAGWLAFRHRRFTLALASLAIGVAFWEVAIGFASWLAGSALHFAQARYKVAKPLASGFIALGLAVLAIAIVAEVADVILALGAALFLFGVLNIDFRWPRLLQGLSDYGANASFSLYAVHMPVIVLLSVTVVWDARLAATPAAIAGVLALTAIAVAFAGAFARITEQRTSELRILAWRALRIKATRA